MMERKFLAESAERCLRISCPLLSVLVEGAARSIHWPHLVCLGLTPPIARARARRGHPPGCPEWAPLYGPNTLGSMSDCSSFGREVV